MGEGDLYSYTPDDQWFPSLNSVSGVLLAGPSYDKLPEWSGRAEPLAAQEGDLPFWLVDELHAQPVEVTGTGTFLGRVYARPLATLTFRISRQSSS